MARQQKRCLGLVLHPAPPLQPPVPGDRVPVLGPNGRQLTMQPLHRAPPGLLLQLSLYITFPSLPHPAGVVSSPHLSPRRAGCSACSSGSTCETRKKYIDRLNLQGEIVTRLTCGREPSCRLGYVYVQCAFVYSILSRRINRLYQGPRPVLNKKRNLPGGGVSSRVGAQRWWFKNDSEPKSG